MFGTTHARVKIEAVGNIFFDVSNANFAITWPFTSFFPPIANSGLNSANAGSAVPIKFSLGGDRGLGIFADGYPVSVQINCTTGVPIGPPVPTSPAGGSGLQYDPVLSQYTYVWKTQAAWSGTGRELQVLLVDGTMHTARFKLK